ncbi:MAG TPA: integrase [Candidatus Saccharimonadia bacterium]|nr:integrase [Candidatus Saccharimonadia bacterium]
MPLMSAELYDALIEAGASEEKARKAAEAVAAYDNRFAALERKLDVLTWMVSFNLILSLGVLWRLLK